MSKSSFYAYDPQPFLTRFSKLDEDEQKSFEIIGTTIRGKNPKDMTTLEATLAEADPIILFKFFNQKENAETSKIIHEFCKHNSYLNEVWENDLKSKGYPYFDIIDVKGNKKYDMLDQVIGAALWTEFDDRTKSKAESKEETVSEDDMELLSLASQHGCLSAILKYQKLLLNKIRLAALEKNQKLLSELVLACTSEDKSIGSAFWTPGYTQAAIVLFAIAQRLSSEENGLFSKNCYEASFQALCVAQLLSDKNESKQLQQVINNGQGIQFSVDDETKKFKNWDDAKLFIAKSAGLNNLERNTIQDEAISLVKSFELEMSSKNSPKF